ncbi:MAG: hypothetical protein NVS1B12_05230 [Acidimicrobiales bacterium]
MAAAPTTSASDTPGPVVEPAAPPVVAVVVTCNPGWWLEECIASLAAQDYPGLSVLVVDADSSEDPTPRVGAVMPGAFVRRVRRRRGFAAAANEVLANVQGASHFVFCHDDVALEPGAVRLLVEESFRSNAGIVAPKLVGWFAPDRLIATGMGADRFGVPVALVERGELDQEQHDAMREVFYAPSACVLVRADLFATLGGFDAAYGPVGEDLDLAWRVHLAGAKVVFAPGARVRHLEATEGGQRALDGELRAAGPDAESRAEAVGLVSAVFDDELPDGGIGAEEPDDATPVLLATGAADDAVWDLSRWDEEEAAEVADAAAAAAARHAGHHASWRARRDAERTSAADAWTGDDDDWEIDSWSSRRRTRRVAAARSRQADRAAAASRSGWRGVRREPGRDGRRERGPDADALDDRRAEARLRAVATNYSRGRLLTRLPLLLVLTVIEAGVRLVRRGPVEARRALRPWSALVRQSGAVRVRRRIVRATRAVSDGEVTAIQVSGTARIRHALRSAALPALDGESERGLGRGRRTALVVWIAAIAVVGYGSRRVMLGHLPTIGSVAPWPSVGTLWRYFGSGWRSNGLGSGGPAPTILGVLAVGGTIALGHTTGLQHVLVVGMIPVGAIGAARLGRSFPSRRAPLVALVAYLAVPLPYNALAGGRWGALVAYGATPWLVALLLRATGAEPFRIDEAEESTGRAARRLSLPVRVVAVALVTALVAAVEPGYLLVVAVTGVAVLVGLLLAARNTTGIRSAVAAILGAGLATILLAPWSTSWRAWAAFTGVAPSAAYAVRLPTLLRFQTGPVGAGPVGYALLVAAALPLIIGRGWRSSWAVALWTVALSSWAMAWAGQHHALGVVWPSVDLALAPAAVALAALAALGMTAFDWDLPGYIFGWRQVVSGGAALALAVACVPVLAAAGDGRWRQPAAGYDAVLSWMQQKQADGDFRVLWIGAPDVLPVSGWPLDAMVAYATTRNGAPQLTDGWPPAVTGPTARVRDVMTLARNGQTTDLGHLLAPMGIRYVAVVEHANPLERGPRHARPIPMDLHDGLESQLDMGRVDRSDALTVYENDAWAPIRIRLPDGATAAAQSGDLRSARTATLHGAPPVLPDGRGPTSFRGPVAAGSAIEVAEAPSSRWTLTAGGQRATRQSGFGVANLFTSDGGGPGVLRYRTPVAWRLAQAAEAVAWVLAVAVVVRGRRRPRAIPADGDPR